MAKEDFISDDDLRLASEIFRRAITFRPQLEKVLRGEELRDLTEEEHIREALTPKIGIRFIGKAGNIPCLYLRLVGTVSALAEIMFYPYEAICVFLSDSRKFARNVAPENAQPADVEKLAVDIAEEMTLIMVDGILKRADLMTDSLVSEVLTQWHLKNRQNLKIHSAARGNRLSKEKDRSMKPILKFYTDGILKHWEGQLKVYESGQHMRLAENYDGGIYDHWKMLSRLSRKNEDWRESAKTPPFSDTPDDLLDKLEDSDRLDQKAVEVTVSELALEHAARRVGLIKQVRVSEPAIIRRKRGIKVTDFTSTHTCPK